MFFIIYGGRILLTLISPLGLSIALLTGAVLQYKHPRRARVLSFAAICLLATLSAPAVSWILLDSLENRYPDQPAQSLPAAQAIVVLGGALRVPGGSHRAAELTDSSDRYLRAFRLYRLGKAPLIICSGGDLAGKSPEAEFAFGLLREWGLPPEAILQENRSRNTLENAQFTWELAHPRGISRILLVTSATHMNRAAALFRKAGFDVIPAATDYKAGWGEPDMVSRCLPSAEALAESGTVIKEWIGLLASRLLGWA